MHAHLLVVPGFTTEAIKDYASSNIAPGSRVLSDGLGCFTGIAEAGLTHVVEITGGGRPEGPEFKWVNTSIANTKVATAGTLRACDAHHTPR